MIFGILVTFVVSWLLLSLAAYYFVKKAFKKYRNYPRIEVPENTLPAIRSDFGKWDESAIVKGCFLRFPLHLVAMAGFLAIYGLIAGLQKRLKFPNSFVNFYRYIGGRLASRICFNYIEQYDYKQKITTPIIISNHVNWLDFIYMGTCLEPVSFVAKKQVKQVLAFNAISENVRTLYVDRSSPEARHKIKEQILQRVIEYKNNPNDNYPIIIYPEGTVTNGRSIISFMNGAFQPLCPITIFSLKYECKQFHLGMDQVSTLDHAFITLCLYPTQRLKRQIITPLEKETVEQYRERCRSKLQELSGFKLYDCDYKTILNYEKTFRAHMKQQKTPAN